MTDGAERVSEIVQGRQDLFHEAVALAIAGTVEFVLLLGGAGDALRQLSGRAWGDSAHCPARLVQPIRRDGGSMSVEAQRPIEFCGQPHFSSQAFLFSFTFDMSPIELF